MSIKDQLMMERLRKTAARVKGVIGRPWDSGGRVVVKNFRTGEQLCVGTIALRPGHTSCFDWHDDKLQLMRVEVELPASGL